MLDRLQMGVNRSLLTRLGFCLSLQPWTLTESSADLERRLREVGYIGSSTLYFSQHIVRGICYGVFLSLL